MVEAGYKVGVVRQMETAALKAVSNNKSKAFERSLCEVYTKATISLLKDIAKIAIKYSKTPPVLLELCIFSTAIWSKARIRVIMVIC